MVIVTLIFTLTKVYLNCVKVNLPELFFSVKGGQFTVPSKVIRMDYLKKNKTICSTAVELAQ